MIKELKDKWIKALRSGEYKQGKQLLRSGNNLYCCLGVLCEVMGTRATKPNDVNFYYYDGNSGALSDTLAIQAGLKHSDQRVCVSMNDKDEFSFNQIADWLEAHEI